MGKRHGMTGCRLHRIWKGMRTRTFNKRRRDYQWYEGKGFYDGWNQFLPFYEWAISHGYADNLTIDRIDNSKGYSPDNCRWITNEEQASNRTTNHPVEIDGKRYGTLTEACRAYNIPLNNVSARIFMLKWPVEKALKTPILRRRNGNRKG